MTCLIYPFYLFFLAFQGPSTLSLRKKSGQWAVGSRIWTVGYVAITNGSDCIRSYIKWCGSKKTVFLRSKVEETITVSQVNLRSAVCPPPIFFFHLVILYHSINFTKKKNFFEAPLIRQKKKKKL